MIMDCAFSMKQRFPDFSVSSPIALTVKADRQMTENGLFEYTVDLQWDAGEAREQNAAAILRFDLPCVDTQYMWHPDCRAKRVLDADWRLNIPSMLTGSAPVAMLFNGEGRNTFTFAHSEVSLFSRVEFGVHDEGGSVSIAGKIELGLRQFGRRDRACLRIRADQRRVPCHEALDGVRKWWEAILPVLPMPVPDAARKPVYSTWYNYHKELDSQTLETECRLAKKMGMDTLIVDDGWQTDSPAGGYGFTGDWVPCEGKFPDMREFVKTVHRLGMKVMLWYSVPFVGYFSGNWDRFRNKLLRLEERNHTGILDPRFPEVRQFLKNVFLSALKNYDLDGLKLDFIDRIRPADPDESRPGMDFKCVQEATEYMMADTMQALREIRPDILIEFRQRYIGPRMRQFGNMFRVADCPADITSNRVGICDLRMLGGNTAVHSDMVLWNGRDTPEDAALQILNTLFGVTQLSGIIGKMSPEHRRMTAFWLRFERENQKVLQESRFIPAEPQSLYPVITACDDREEITGVYANDRVIAPDWQKHRIQLVNASWQPRLALRFPTRTNLAFRIYDCMGTLVREGSQTFLAGIREIPVPRSGLAVLEPDALSTKPQRRI